MRIAELDMHPLDAAEAEEGLDRKADAQDEHGLGYCNITKCCTEVCPEHIKITDNAIIPMKERVVDRRYDPLVWLGRKIFRRDELENQPAHAGASAGNGASNGAGSGENMTPSISRGVTGDAAGVPGSSSRMPEPPHLGPDGKLDVAELLSQRAGGPSPFGDEQTFPLPPGQVSYNHPRPGKDDDPDQGGREH
jgi:succinate dehydrogenase / fumarate reductase iron-sulfur subunit